MVIAWSYQFVFCLYGHKKAIYWLKKKLTAPDEKLEENVKYCLDFFKSEHINLFPTFFINSLLPTIKSFFYKRICLLGSENGFHYNKDVI